MKHMTARQFAILRDLHDDRWMRPMDVGGRDASHHSATLAQLVRDGHAERRTRGSNRSFEYRRTTKERTTVFGDRPVDRLAGGVK